MCVGGLPVRHGGDGANWQIILHPFHLTDDRTCWVRVRGVRPGHNMGRAPGMPEQTTNYELVDGNLTESRHR